MSRIQPTFQRLSAQGRKALIPFITAGDPDADLTVPLMHALVEAGADIIELGVPFSDPMADGPTIQRASERALARGMTLRKVLQLVTTFRTADDKTPVVLMGYANPIEAMGLTVFADKAAQSGVDGVLVVDYPPEEAAAFGTAMKTRGMDPIFLLAPTSSDARVAQAAERAGQEPDALLLVEPDLVAVIDDARVGEHVDRLGEQGGERLGAAGLAVEREEAAARGEIVGALVEELAVERLATLDGRALGPHQHRGRRISVLEPNLGRPGQAVRLRRLLASEPGRSGRCPHRRPQGSARYLQSAPGNEIPRRDISAYPLLP